MNSRFMLGAFSILAFGACIDQQMEDPQDEDLSPASRLAANGLAPAQLNALLPLDPSILDQAHLDALAVTEDGRQALKYLVGCALADGHNITAYYTDPVTGPEEFHAGGSVGMADGWTSGALTTTQQKWLTSCVSALTNRTGASVTVSVRGPSTTLSSTSTELTTYVTQEGAYFGNAFTATGILACKGTGTVTTTGRDCAKGTSVGGKTQCNFTYTGTCATVCSAGSQYMNSCTYSGTTYAQAVTAYD
jgi:hypothetical protein